MNFSPFGGHFPAMHQFAAAKFSNEQLQAGTMLVTSASDGTIQYIRPEHNGANFITTSSSNTPVQAIPMSISTTVNIPVSSARALTAQQPQGAQQHTLAAMVNQSTCTTKYHHPSGAILSWGDMPVMHHFNDTSKNITTINVPYPAQAVNQGTTILTVQPTQATAAPAVWPVRIMQNVSTMTVDESELQPQDLCKAVESGKMKDDVKEEMVVKCDVKDSGDSDDDSDDSSKSNMEGPSSTCGTDAHKSVQMTTPLNIPNGNLECHQIQLQQQGSAMADYLARLPASTIPLSLQHFFKYQTESVANSNICIKRESENASGMLLGGAAIAPVTNVNANAALASPKKKKKKKSIKKPPRPRPGEIRISTALDGSTLYCCPECHMAYPDHEMLGQHLSGHKLERRFVCNECGAGLKRKEHLDQHKRGHSEERPFVCTLCLKGFKRNEHLTRHYVIHSGDKSHCCIECGKKFSRKDHLHKHTQTHIAKRVKAELSQAGVGAENQQPPQQQQQQQQHSHPSPQGIVMQHMPHHAMTHPLPLPLHLHHAMS